MTTTTLKFIIGDKICYSSNIRDKSAHYDVVDVVLHEDRYILKSTTEPIDNYNAKWLGFYEDGNWTLREESLVDRILTKYNNL